MAILKSWEQIDISNSRRPILLPNEHIIYIQNNVGLYSGKQKLSGFQDGVLYITGYRIYYVDSAKPSLNSLALDLAKIDKIEHYAGFLKSSPKITIRCAQASNETSGRSTPLPSALVPTKSKSAGDWICPICTFTNALLPGFVEGSRLPACTNCGMVPPKSTKVSSSTSNGDSSTARPTSTITKSGLTFPCPRCTFGNHPAITSCELCGAPLISKNLPPMLHSNNNDDERGTSSAPTEPFTDDGSFKLSFRSAGDKVCLEKLRQAISDRAWERQLASATTTTTPKERRGAGIGALQSREELLRAAHATTMSSALEDLQGLMSAAKEMISLAESLASRVNNSAASVMQVALHTPIVTKESTSRAAVYHAELARQISDFLEGTGLLRAEGGVITLVDVFAYYNRARRGNLISPEELLAATQLLEPLKLPIRIRRFKSGVCVLQEVSRSDAATRRSIMQWIRSRTVPGVTAIDAVEMFGWSVPVATQELETVEEYGDLARDVTVEGTRFYENLLK